MKDSGSYSQKMLSCKSPIDSNMSCDAVFVQKEVKKKTIFFDIFLLRERGLKVQLRTNTKIIKIMFYKLPTFVLISDKFLKKLN